MAKKKPETGYTNVYLDGCGDDGYTVFYTDLNDKPRSMRLDGETYGEAKSEAASYLEVPESEIGDA